MILGRILQSMGALKGNRVACHSPFPQRLDQISLIGIIAEQANVTPLLRHRWLERRVGFALQRAGKVGLAAEQFDLRLPFLFHCYLRNHGSLVRFCRQQRKFRRMRLCLRSAKSRHWIAYKSKGAPEEVLYPGLLINCSIDKLVWDDLPSDQWVEKR